MLTCSIIRSSAERLGAARRRAQAELFSLDEFAERIRGIVLGLDTPARRPVPAVLYG